MAVNSMLAEHFHNFRDERISSASVFITANQIFEHRAVFFIEDNMNKQTFLNPVSFFRFARNFHRLLGKQHLRKNIGFVIVA